MKSKEIEVLNMHISLLNVLLAFSIIVISIELCLILALSKRYIEKQRTTQMVQYPVVTTLQVTTSNEIEVSPVLHSVYFTNYYTNDRTGSTDKTGSGKKTTEFMVNERGWFTYDNKVVLAGATYEGLKSNYGILANFNEELAEINYHHYGDTIKIYIDGDEYDAIILDTCGACMTIQNSDDNLQRYDIMVSGQEYAFGKLKGIVYE